MKKACFHKFEKFILSFWSLTWSFFKQYSLHFSENCIKWKVKYIPKVTIFFLYNSDYLINLVASTSLRLPFPPQNSCHFISTYFKLICLSLTNQYFLLVQILCSLNTYLMSSSHFELSTGISIIHFSKCYQYCMYTCAYSIGVIKLSTNLNYIINFLFILVKSYFILISNCTDVNFILIA